MKIAFVAKADSMVEKARPFFEAQGFRTTKDPATVVVIGGDGTFLRAEREYPGVPKALIKDSEVGFLYQSHSAEELAVSLAHNQYTIKERVALEATVHHVKYRAANDVIIRNHLLTHAIRFKVLLDGEPLGREFIGDGVVVATPAGSTAYYHSITGKTFSEGIGMALNNLTNETEVPQLADNQEIVVAITRGPADLGVDNSLHVEQLREGDEVRIRKSAVPVRIICLKKQ